VLPNIQSSACGVCVVFVWCVVCESVWCVYVCGVSVFVCVCGVCVCSVCVTCGSL